MTQRIIVCLCFLLASVAHAEDFSVVERDGVRIEGSLQAHLYSWRVTNLRPEPIVRFEMEQHHSYGQRVPTGWEFEHEDSRFVAWATEERFGIQQSKSGVFTARGASDGAFLGLAPAVVSFGPDHGEVVFDAVWAPIKKPQSLVWLVVLTIVGLAALHVVLIRRWSKSAAPNRVGS